MVLDLVSWVLLVSGGLFCIIGGVGIIRLPDFYTRTHGASITDTLGAGLMLAGLGVQTFPHFMDGDWLILVKLVAITIFLFITSPTSGHALVKAAYARGVRWDQGETTLDEKDEE
jgi:multicomponent Na+:H+ antiporter subunit G|tara:strand:+ start:47 stop:391 length:345 start_codon:yes stop_codon:yes gene_type:complete